jgi:hypothetical protein
MLNVTIKNAYVDYTYLCLESKIVISEGDTIREDTELEYFCGHVLLESVYTRRSKGTLLINAMLSHQVSLLATYQVHAQGYAHKFVNTDFNSPTKWTILQAGKEDVKPSVVHFVSGHLFYLWYFSRATMRKYMRGSKHCPSLIENQHLQNRPNYLRQRFVELQITSFTCSLGSGYLSVHRALLPVHLLTSSSEHADGVRCDRKGRQAAFLAPRGHHYHTVLLSINVWEDRVKVLIAFAMKGVPGTSFHKEIMESDNYTKHIDDADFQSLFFFNCNRKQIRITFTHFKYFGRKHTVQSHLVHRILNIQPENAAADILGKATCYYKYCHDTAVIAGECLC